MENLFVTKNENKKLLTVEALYEEGEFLKALNELERYLVLYPRDLKALFLRGKMYRMLQSPNEARSVFLQLFPYISENKEYKVKILTELLYLEIQERNYLSAYSYLGRLQKITNSVKGLNFDLAEVYLKHQSGMQDSVEDKFNYFEKQIVSYDEEKCLKRLLFNNKSYSSTSTNFRHFSLSLDLKDLYDQIKNVLPLATITPAYNVFDTYIFSYPNAGYDEEGTLDYLQVLAYSDIEGVHILEISPFRAKKYKSYVNDLLDLEYQKIYFEESISYSRTKEN